MSNFYKPNINLYTSLLSNKAAKPAKCAHCVRKTIQTDKSQGQLTQFHVNLRSTKKGLDKLLK